MKKTILRLSLIPFILLILYIPYGHAQTLDYGKSYVNITKGLNGGTIEPGDTLEVRASIVVRSGVFDSCGYFDAIPPGTVYIPGTLRVLTNEGKIYKQFTDAQYDDEGWMQGANFRINLGFRQTDNPARSYRRGRIGSTHKPSFYGSACIMVASFRVRVIAPIGSIINMGGGSLTYAIGTNPIQTVFFPANSTAVYTNIGLCPNQIGANGIGTEFNGTFGSGRNRNRGSSANVPPGYVYSFFTTNMPNDYYYGIANNTSTQTNYSTSNGWAKPDLSSPTHRVFQAWDIIGDHTGAADPLLGNPASDTVNNANGGYMLVVNAAYRIDSAFQQTITGLCPNTYYEISCWVRNICSKCGCDSNGKGASNTSASPAPYIPTVAGPAGQADSSGVYPNLTFEVNGLDYYTTGNIRYTGRWIKKGFTVRTGPTENSIVLKVKNNAPGGGGNDWALDDISVATCYPNLIVTPDPNLVSCSDNLVNFGATVRSYFNTYTQYKWQRSTNNGTTWSDVGVSGTGFPTLVNGQYQYSVDYPTFIATQSDSGHNYRIVVATTAPNLASTSCSQASSTEYTTLDIIQCTLLPLRLVSWSARKSGDRISLKWMTEEEKVPVTFIIEKSTDGIRFESIGTVEGRSGLGADNTYYFTDPESGNQKTYYRLRIRDASGDVQYSSILTIEPHLPAFEVKLLGNPFRQTIQLELALADEATLSFRLTDSWGRAHFTERKHIHSGRQVLRLECPVALPSGVYILQVVHPDRTVQWKLKKE